MELKEIFWDMNVTNTNLKGQTDKSFTTIDKVYIAATNEDDKLHFTGVNPTDYAVLCGARLTDNNVGPFGKKGSWRFVRSISEQGRLIVYQDGQMQCLTTVSKDSVVRPHMCLKTDIFTVLKKAQQGLPVADGFTNIPKKYVYDFNVKILKDPLNAQCQYGRTIELGEYPRSVVTEDKILFELNMALHNNTLNPTGRKFFGYIKTDNEPLYFQEYELHGEKYVCVIPKPYMETKTFADSTPIENRTYFWVKVEPIRWLITNWGRVPKQINPIANEADNCIYITTVEGIISGLPFHSDSNVNAYLWQNSSIRAFLNGINTSMISSNGNIDLRLKNPTGHFEKQGFIDTAFSETKCLTKANSNVKNASAIKPSVNAQNSVQQKVASNSTNILNNAILNKNTSASKTKGTNRSRLDRLNPDTTSKDQREFLTDTQKIYNWIEAGSSVLLRGPSGIGKTERLKNLYPNLIYIKLTNNMFPEKVVGSMNLQTGQSVPPDFAKEAILQEATEEEKKLINENIQNLYSLADKIYERSKSSDEKIVILLDELLNVKPAVQSLVYTLVLNKLVETGKGLKLPANTVVVATGNQKKYSNVAEDLAEPLEKRFDHILDMQPKVGEWIDEYAIPHNVHPVVVSYIWSNYIKNELKEDLNSIRYFYEEPEVGEQNLDENGCRGRTNDPRGWVSLSNSLYAFEKDLKEGKFIGKNVEDILQSLISSKLRNDWAVDFYEFYNSSTLTIDEICNKKYTENDLPKTVNEKFAYVFNLLYASEKQVKECRNFIKKYCSSEYLSLYDIYWARKDEKRIELLTELDQLSMM